MGELKSAYELAMEKLKARGQGEAESTLTQEQKEELAQARRETQAKIAEREIMLKAKLQRLPERTPPEEIPLRRAELEAEHAEERRVLERELEERIGRIKGAEDGGR
jgi:hypothetical protein